MYVKVPHRTSKIFPFILSGNSVEEMRGQKGQKGDPVGQSTRAPRQTISIKIKIAVFMAVVVVLRGAFLILCMSAHVGMCVCVCM